VKMSSTGNAHNRYDAALFVATYPTPELHDHGIGGGDPESLRKQAHLVMKCAVGPRAERPNTDVIFSNMIAGKIKLTRAGWEPARKSATEFALLPGIKV
jgi:hypothetical protein